MLSVGAIAQTAETNGKTGQFTPLLGQVEINKLFAGALEVVDCALQAPAAPDRQ